MGLFNKNKEIEIFNLVSGHVIPISEVHDEIFASKTMGDGFGVLPNNGDIYSPIQGKVISVFPTKHAISLLTKNGTEVLVHIGIDTVELNGEGFNIQVGENDKVDESTLLAKVDLGYLQDQEKSTDIMVIFTNLDNRELDLKFGETIAKKKIGMIK